MNLLGHWRTIRPHIKKAIKGTEPVTARRFRIEIPDGMLGKLSLTGRMSHVSDDELVVLVHGIGGSAGSHYMMRAAKHAEEMGLSALRLNLRGADRFTPDYYHAGLVEDLNAVLRSPELARYSRIYLYGFSLGGHVVLRYLTRAPDPRVASACALCPPLDLHLGVQYFDSDMLRLYRWHVLKGLKSQYQVVAGARDVPVEWSQAQKISTMSDWDERIVAPRFGFDSALQYWTQMSVAEHLPAIRIPTLVSVMRDDPMVTYDTVTDPLRKAWNVTTVAPRSGGHVGNIPDLGLGEAGREDAQVLNWLRRWR